MLNSEMVGQELFNGGTAEREEESTKLIFCVRSVSFFFFLFTFALRLRSPRLYFIYTPIIRTATASDFASFNLWNWTGDSEFRDIRCVFENSKQTRNQKTGLSASSDS